MKDLVRTLIAAIVGAVVAIAVVVGQPALASQVDKARVKKVTSAMIKDGTIKKQDLNAEVTGPLAKADTALQSVPDNSVTTNKLANTAVTNPKLADNVVTGAKVTDGSLKLSDLAAASGTTPFDSVPLAANQCGASGPINTGVNVTGDILLISAPALIVGSLQVDIREDSGSTTSVDIVVCNNSAGAIDPINANYTWAVIDH